MREIVTPSTPLTWNATAWASRRVLIICSIEPAPGTAKWHTMPTGTFGIMTDTTCPLQTPLLVIALPSVLASVCVHIGVYAANEWKLITVNDTLHNVSSSWRKRNGWLVGLSRPTQVHPAHEILVTQVTYAATGLGAELVPVTTVLRCMCLNT